jgi:hypothetical protein
MKGGMTKVETVARAVCRRLLADAVSRVFSKLAMSSQATSFFAAIDPTSSSSILPWGETAWMALR